eukprot:3163945-Pyramimonas_sp.AAC.1
MEKLVESMVGEVQFPKSASGLRLEADYELLRLLPTKKDPSMQSPDHLHSWLNQRRDGEPAPVKKHHAMGNDPQPGQPSSIGAWPAVDAA